MSKAGLDKHSPPPTECSHSRSYWALSVSLRKSKSTAARHPQACLPTGFLFDHVLNSQLRLTFITPLYPSTGKKNCHNINMTPFCSTFLLYLLSHQPDLHVASLSGRASPADLTGDKLNNWNVSPHTSSGFFAWHCCFSAPPSSTVWLYQPCLVETCRHKFF